MMKDLIGKELSKFSMPVFINEPSSLLMKPAEFSFYTNYLTKAAAHSDPVNRMVYVTTSMLSGYYTVPNRMGKPFNPLLGETYELVAPDFRYFSEQVSHHPPIACYNLEGLNFEVQRQFETGQHFTGKSVKIIDKNKQIVHLTLPNGQKETYLSKEPMIVVGNLFVGTTYIEPQGSSSMTCNQTNTTCSIDYKVRNSWKTKHENEHFVSAVINDSSGKKCYKIEGQYTKELIGTDLRTGDVTTLFKAADKPQNHIKMFGMNLHALQLNYLPDSLRNKIPPTDSRLRSDLRAWDQANLTLATKEKTRLEQNQRIRRTQVKKMLAKDSKMAYDWNINDERTFYNPQYFEKRVIWQNDGSKSYWYEPKKSSKGNTYNYWEEREQANWSNAPRIYDDDCHPFY